MSPIDAEMIMMRKYCRNIVIREMSLTRIACLVLVVGRRPNWAALGQAWVACGCWARCLGTFALFQAGSVMQTMLSGGLWNALAAVSVR
jgi:hypothetical protein